MLPVALLLMIPALYTQEQNATCLDSAYSWALNDLNQDPCTVSAYLYSACTNNLSFFPPLAPWHAYPTPTADNENECSCSFVFYSLVAACSDCQTKSLFSPWSEWTAQCATQNISSGWPLPVPNGTAIPLWASKLGVNNSGTYDPSVAKNLVETPASKSLSSTDPSSSTSTNSSSSSTMQTAPSSSSQSSVATATGSASRSKAGAIAGGVIGGVVVLALLAALAVYLVKRTRVPMAPSAAYKASAAQGYESPTSGFRSESRFGSSPIPVLVTKEPTSWEADQQQPQLWQHPYSRATYAVPDPPDFTNATTLQPLR